MLDTQHLRAKRLPAGREDVGKLAADHHRHQPAFIQLFHPARAHQSTIFQDRDQIGNLEDLLKPVGDVDDGNPLCFEAPDRLEQCLHIVAAKDGRRLIEHEQARISLQRTRNLDQLSLRDTEEAHRAVQVDAHAEQIHDLLSPPVWPARR